MPWLMRKPSLHRLLVGLLLLTLLTLSDTLPAEGFGTLNSLGQSAEHERITRAALACGAAGLPMIADGSGSCFEARSIDQLAGSTGTLGAVGAPDIDEFLRSAAHCDDADYLAGGYPRTRAQATAQLQACVHRIRGRALQGIARAPGMLVKGKVMISREDVDLTRSCTFVPSFPGRGKCNVIEGFGRELHGIQDFYSHSNWTDKSNPAVPISISNPPGLYKNAPSGLLDLKLSNANPGALPPAADVPMDFSTGFFKIPLPFRRDVCPGVDRRITHACLNKDMGNINPANGIAVVTPDTQPRGLILDGLSVTNLQRAVTGAVEETRRQWQDFKDALTLKYGNPTAKLMICAITRDDPVKSCHKEAGH